MNGLRAQADKRESHFTYVHDALVLEYPRKEGTVLLHVATEQQARRPQAAANAHVPLRLEGQCLAEEGLLDNVVFLLALWRDYCFCWGTRHGCACCLFGVCVCGGSGWRAVCGTWWVDGTGFDTRRYTNRNTIHCTTTPPPPRHKQPPPRPQLAFVCHYRLFLFLFLLSKLVLCNGTISRLTPTPIQST